MAKVAILVDGGFYRYRSHSLFGEKSAEERADELFKYCMAHIHGKRGSHDLYRIFYYDCEPSDEQVFNPISKKTIQLSKTDVFKWTTEFFGFLKQKRKLALRLGRLSLHNPFILKYETIKQLSNGKKRWEEITERDLTLNLEQKGVDMRIGVDISSLAFKKQVDQIVLVSGDSDFVPAAKLARREGIDFVLDPMGAHIADDLFEHVDGIQTRIKKFMPKPNQDDVSSGQ